MSTNALTRLHHEIDAVDTELFRLIEERTILSREVQKLRNELGETERDTAREHAQAQRAGLALGSSLGDSAAKQLWTLLLDLTHGETE